MASEYKTNSESLRHRPSSSRQESTFQLFIEDLSAYNEDPMVDLAKFQSPQTPSQSSHTPLNAPTYSQVLASDSLKPPHLEEAHDPGRPNFEAAYQYNAGSSSSTSMHGFATHFFGSVEPTAKTSSKLLNQQGKQATNGLSDATALVVEEEGKPIARLHMLGQEEEIKASQSKAKRMTGANSDPRAWLEFIQEQKAEEISSCLSITRRRACTLPGPDTTQDRVQQAKAEAEYRRSLDRAHRDEPQVPTDPVKILSKRLAEQAKDIEALRRELAGQTRQTIGRREEAEERAQETQRLYQELSASAMWIKDLEEECANDRHDIKCMKRELDLEQKEKKYMETKAVDLRKQLTKVSTALCICPEESKQLRCKVLETSGKQTRQDDKEGKRGDMDGLIPAPLHICHRSKPSEHRNSEVANLRCQQITELQSTISDQQDYIDSLEVTARLLQEVNNTLQGEVRGKEGWIVGLEAKIKDLVAQKKDAENVEDAQNDGDSKVVEIMAEKMEVGNGNAGELLTLIFIALAMMVMTVLAWLATMVDFSESYREVRAWYWGTG